MEGGGRVGGTLHRELQGYGGKLHIYCAIQRETAHQLVSVSLYTNTSLLHLPITHRQRWSLEELRVVFKKIVWFIVC